MKVITTENSAKELATTLLTEARDRAAELQRDALVTESRMRPSAQYFAAQEKAVITLRRFAKEVMDMIDVGQYDEKRIIDIRAFTPEIPSKA